MKATIHWVPVDHAIEATVHLHDRLSGDEHPGADGGDPLNPAPRETRTGCKLEPASADTPLGVASAQGVMARRRCRRADVHGI